MAINVVYFEGTRVLKDFCELCTTDISSSECSPGWYFEWEKEKQIFTPIYHAHTPNEGIHLVMTNENFPDGICRI